MARIQILELPEGAGDDRAPFVLVVDETAPQRIALGVDTPWRDYWQDIADKIGARGVIVTPETVEIPANTVTLDDGQVVRLKVEPDLSGFEDAVAKAIAAAQQKTALYLREQSFDGTITVDNAAEVVASYDPSLRRT